MTVGDIAHIALGSNLGARETNIAEAVRKVDALPSTRVTAVSSLYETAPVGKTDQPLFVNAVLAAETELTPESLLRELLRIEAAMGRVRGEPLGPRVIDLDLLIQGEAVSETAELTLPHPRMKERHFVLVPLVEIAPEARDPLTAQPLHEILAALPAVDWGRLVSGPPV